MILPRLHAATAHPSPRNVIAGGERVHRHLQLGHDCAVQALYLHLQHILAKNHHWFVLVFHIHIR